MNKNWRRLLRNANPTFYIFKFSQRQNWARSRAESHAKCIKVLLWPHSSSSVDVESYQNPDDGYEIGFWNVNVYERPDMDVIPRRFYEIFWAIVETLLSDLHNPNREFKIGICSKKHDCFPLVCFIKFECNLLLKNLQSTILLCQ